MQKRTSFDPSTLKEGKAMKKTTNLNWERSVMKKKRAAHFFGKNSNGSNGLKSLLCDELTDIFDAENQIVRTLPTVIKAAESPELKAAFQKHLQETKRQVARLKNIFRHLKLPIKKVNCEAMQGLIDECKEAIKTYEKSPLRDAALISKTQRIEHYEIAVYGTLRTFANELELSAISNLLDETLKEEGTADKTLTKIAEGGFLTSGINQHAIENLAYA